jgi:hypothetical protein
VHPDFADVMINNGPCTSVRTLYPVTQLTLTVFHVSFLSLVEFKLGEKLSSLWCDFPSDTGSKQQTPDHERTPDGMRYVCLELGSIR